MLPRSVDPLTTLPPSHVSEPSASILRVRAAAARSSPEVWKRKGAPIWLIYGAAQVRNGLASLNAAIFLPTATGQQRARSRFARVKAHGKHLHRRARLTPSAFYPDLECGRDSAPRLPGQSRGLTSCSRHPGLHGIHMQHVDRSSWSAASHVLPALHIACRGTRHAPHTGSVSDLHLNQKREQAKAAMNLSVASYLRADSHRGR